MPALYGLSALVSPVSVKKKSRNPSPGWNCPFSGRLNGVAWCALAAAFASNGVVPSVAVSWMVVHRVRKPSPYVCSAVSSGLSASMLTG